MQAMLCSFSALLLLIGCNSFLELRPTEVSNNTIQDRAYVFSCRHKMDDFLNKWNVKISGENDTRAHEIAEKLKLRLFTKTPEGEYVFEDPCKPYSLPYPYFTQLLFFEKEVWAVKQMKPYRSYSGLFHGKLINLLDLDPSNG